MKGIATYDRLVSAPPDNQQLVHLVWSRRELENYLCFPEVPRAYAWADQPDDLFGRAEGERREQVMNECIQDFVPPVALRDRDDRWWSDVKASDEFLDRLFEEYFRRLGLPNLMRKSDYHQLARLVPTELIATEVGEKLDAILRVAEQAETVAEGSGAGAG